MKAIGQIDKYERLEIAILLKRGYSDGEIAQALGRHRSSIYRERIRNTVSGKYNPRKAQHKAYVGRKYAKYQGMRIVEDMKLREYIETKLLVDDCLTITRHLVEMDTPLRL